MSGGARAESALEAPLLVGQFTGASLPQRKQRNTKGKKSPRERAGAQKVNPRWSRDPGDIDPAEKLLINDDQWRTFLFATGGEEGYDDELLQEMIGSGKRRRFRTLNVEDLLNATRSSKLPVHLMARVFLDGKEPVPDELLVLLLLRRLADDREEGLKVKEAERKEADRRRQAQQEKERAEREALQAQLRSGSKAKASTSGKGSKTAKSPNKAPSLKKESPDTPDRGDKSPTGSRSKDLNKSTTIKKDARKDNKKGRTSRPSDAPPVDDEPQEGPDAYYMLVGFPMTADVLRWMAGYDIPLDSYVHVKPKPDEAAADREEIAAGEGASAAPMRVRSQLGRSETPSSNPSPIPSSTASPAVKPSSSKKDKPRTPQTARKRSKKTERTPPVSGKRSAGADTDTASGDVDNEGGADAAEGLLDVPLFPEGWSAVAFRLRSAIDAADADSPLRNIVWVTIDRPTSMDGDALYDLMARRFYDAIGKARHHREWLASMDVSVVPAARKEVDMKVYNRIMDAVAQEDASVLVMMHAMLEQVRVTAPAKMAAKIAAASSTPVPPPLAPMDFDDNESVSPTQAAPPPAPLPPTEEQLATEAELKGFLHRSLGGLFAPAKRTATAKTAPAPLAQPPEKKSEMPTLTVLKEGDTIGLRAALMRQAKRDPLLDGGVEENGTLLPPMRTEDAERAVAACLRVPGRGRARPSGPAAERAIEKQELYNLCSVAPPLIERTLMLFSFEELLNGADRTRTWNLSDRTFSEEFDAQAMAQVFAQARLSQAPLVERAFERGAATLVALLPVMSKTREATTEWEATVRTKVALGTFIDAIEAGSTFFDLGVRLVPFAAAEKVAETEGVKPLALPGALGKDTGAKKAPVLIGRTRKGTVPGKTKEEVVVEAPTMPRRAYQIGDRLVRVNERMTTLYPVDGAVVRVATTTMPEVTQVSAMVHVPNLTFGMYTRTAAARRGPAGAAGASAAARSPEPHSLAGTGPNTERGGRPAANTNTLDSTDPMADPLKAHATFVATISESTASISVFEEPEQLSMTAAMPDGLLIHIGSSRIVQQTRRPLGVSRGPGAGSVDDWMNAEAGRIIFGSATVIRYLGDGAIQIFLADGSTNVFNPTDGSWIQTNPDGARLGTAADTTVFAVPAVHCTDRTDPQTGEVVRSREDMVAFVTRPDGTTTAMFPDGTAITTLAEGRFRVERRGDAPVDIDHEADSVSVRAPDGTVLEAARGGTLVCRLTSGHWLRGCDDEVVVSPAGSAVTYERDRNAREGTYVFSLRSGRMVSLDVEHNAYVVRRDGSCKVTPPGIEPVHLATQAQNDTDSEDEPIGGAAAAGGAARPATGQVEPKSATLTHPPRLFVLRVDGSGAELLDEGVATAALKACESAPLTNVVADGVVGEAGAAAFTIIRRVPALGDGVVRVRQLVRHGQANAAQRAAVQEAVSRYERLLKERTERTAALAAKDPRSAEEVAAENAVRASVKAEREAKRSAEEEKKLALEKGAAQARERTLRELQIEADARRPPPQPEQPPPKILDLRNPNGTPLAAIRPAGIPDKYFATEGGKEFLQAQTATLVAQPGVRVTASSMRPAPKPAANAVLTMKGQSRPPPPDDSDEEDNIGAPPQARARPITGDDRMGREIYSAGAYGNYESLPLEYNASNGGELWGTDGVLQEEQGTGTQPPDSMRETSERRVPRPPAVRGTKSMEVNERYMRVEGPVRRAVKTSSVKQAASAEVPRGQLFGFEIHPDRLNFGTLREGCTYRVGFALTNVGVDPCRFRVKPTTNRRVTVAYTPGPVAPGVKVKLSVDVAASTAGPLYEVLEIVTQAEVFRVPVTATVMPAAQLAALAGGDNKGVAPALGQGVTQVGTCEIEPPTAPTTAATGPGGAARPSSRGQRAPLEVDHVIETVSQLTPGSAPRTASTGSPGRRPRKQWDLPSTGSAAPMLPPVTPDDR